jgi:hypothetical protein
MPDYKPPVSSYLRKIAEGEYRQWPYSENQIEVFFRDGSGGPVNQLLDMNIPLDKKIFEAGLRIKEKYNGIFVKEHKKLMEEIEKDYSE